MRMPSTTIPDRKSSVYSTRQSHRSADAAIMLSYTAKTLPSIVCLEAVERESLRQKSTVFAKSR